MLFASIDGTESVRAAPRAFLEAFPRRVESRLVRGANPRRTHYVVMRKSADGLGFRAVGWLTAIAVGLNDVDVSASPAGIAGCAAFAVVLFAMLLAIDVRSYIAQHAASRVPGLPLDQNVALAWAIGLFWGFVWPWIPILLYRRPLRGLMQRLIVEVDAEARG